MLLVTVHNDKENVARLLRNPNSGGHCFFMSEEETVKLIMQEMVKDVNERGVEDEPMHSVDDLRAHGWYITDDRPYGTRRLIMYSGNPADDPDCDATVYCIIKFGEVH